MKRVVTYKETMYFDDFNPDRDLAAIDHTDYGCGFLVFEGETPRLFTAEGRWYTLVHNVPENTEQSQDTRVKAIFCDIVSELIARNRGVFVSSIKEEDAYHDVVKELTEMLRWVQFGKIGVQMDILKFYETYVVNRKSKNPPNYIAFYFNADTSEADTLSCIRVEGIDKTVSVIAKAFYSDRDIDQLENAPDVPEGYSFINTYPIGE